MTFKKYIKINLIFITFIFLAFSLSAQIMTNNTYKITSDTFDSMLYNVKSSNSPYKMNNSLGQSTPSLDTKLSNASTNIYMQSGYLLLPLSAPQTPQGINSTTSSTEQIIISWNDLPNETSYTLFRDTDNNPVGAVTIGLSNNQTNYTDSILNPNTTYYYWVKAYNSEGESGFSTVISNTTHPITPLQPQGIIATSISTNQINLIWNDLPNETSYTLFRDTDNNPAGAVKFGLSANQTNYSDIGLITNTTYYYWVKAYNITGESPFSLIISNTTLPPDSTPPNEISSLNIQSLPNGKQATLTWQNPPDSDFAGVIIVRKLNAYPTSTNDGTAFYITNNSINTYDDINLEMRTRYYYRIYAFDDNGNISSGVTGDIETLSGLGHNKFAIKKPVIRLNRGEIMEFEYNTDAGANVTFDIYTMMGTLVNTIRGVNYRVYWDGKNSGGRTVANGFYLIIMRVNGQKTSSKPRKVGVLK